MNKETFLKSLDEIEWFIHPQNNREKIDAKIKESDGDFYLDLHHFSFFSDDFYAEKDFNTLLVELEEIIGIKFNEPSFTVDEDANTLHVKMKIKAKTVEIHFDLNEFIMIPQIEQKFNLIFEKLDLDSRLMWLPLESDIFFYVYIPVSLYKRAVEKGIIPKESEYYNQL